MTEYDWSESKEIGVARVDNLRADHLYVATDGEKYWKDTYPSGAIDAAYDSDCQFNDAEEIEEPEELTFFTIEITGDYYARRKNDDVVQHGETPGESVMDIILPDEPQSLKQPDITDARTIKKQILDIISQLDGAVYITDIQDRFNEDLLKQPVPNKDELIIILSEMADDNKVRRARGNYDTWWEL